MPNFLNLPNDLVQKIIADYISERDVPAVTLVSKKHHETVAQLLEEPDYWNKRVAHYFPHKYARLHSLNTNWREEYESLIKQDYGSLNTEQRRLFQLVKEGDVASLKKLNLAFNDIEEVPDGSGFSLLKWARYKNHQNILDYFYAVLWGFYAADPASHAIDPVNHRTALYWALRCRQSGELISLLLHQGCHPEEIYYPGDRLGRSYAIHVAVEEQRLDVIKALVATNFQLIDIENFSNATALHLAAYVGDIDIVRYLLLECPQRAFPDGRSVRDDSYCTPLYYAAVGGHETIVNLLLTAGASVTPKSLYAAALNGHLNIVKMILSRNNNLLHQTLSTQHTTVLGAAAIGGHVTLLKYLLSEGANINGENDYQHSPIAQALAYNHIAAFEILARQGAIINTQLLKANLLVALAKVPLDLLKMLLLRYPELLTLVHLQRDLLWHATHQGNLEPVQWLLTKRKTGSNPLGACFDLDTSLQLAFERGHLNIIAELIMAGAEGTLTFLKPQLAKAFQINSLKQQHDVSDCPVKWRQIIKAWGHSCNWNIIKNFMTVTKISEQQLMLLILQNAVAEFRWDAVKLIVKQFDDLGLMDFSEIDLRVFFKKFKISRLTNDDFKSTMLLFAAALGHTEIMKYWEEQRVEFSWEELGSLPHFNGKTALHWASENGHIDTVRHLIKTIPRKRLDPVDSHKYTPLHLALANNHGEIAEILVNAGAIGSFNTLFVAAEKGLLWLIKRLLNRYPVLLNAKDTEQQTLLMRAAAKGHIHVVTYLLEQGACLVPLQGKSALGLAWENRHPAIVTQLLLHAAHHPLKALSHSDLASNKPFVKIALAIEKLAEKTY